MTKDPSNTSRDDTGRFVIGNKPGPGRPKGSRSKLGTVFLDALYADFCANGEAAIRMARSQNALGYVKLVSDVLPKEIVTAAFSVNATVDLSEEFERAASFADAYKVLQAARDRLGARPMLDLTPEAETAWRSDADD